MLIKPELSANFSDMKTKDDFPGVLGCAPRLAAWIVPWLVIAVAASILLPGAFRFEGRFRGVWFAFALWYSACAIVFYADVAFRLLKALSSKTLAKHGTYGFCRHPLYAWWIFFVFPAAAMLLDNWLFVLCSVFLAFGARRSLWIEDRYLKESFGDEYREYRTTVRELLPVPRIKPVNGLRLRKFLLFIIVLAGCSLAFLVAAIRPALLRFGATAAEVSSVLPGDERIPLARDGYTQAITIDAPPRLVWRWLIQVGYRRAGWYNIDAINRLAGRDYFIDGKGSSNRIVPSLQDLKVGDRIGLTPTVGFGVIALEKERTFFLGTAVDAKPSTVHSSGASWIFTLSPLPGDRTRLVTRFRSDFPGGIGMFMLNDIINTFGGAMLQQPAMFVGLSRRAAAEWRSEKTAQGEGRQ
jgi:protein-S-isoprenylcysteine O-methyltransferase Ste14